MTFEQWWSKTAGTGISNNELGCILLGDDIVHKEIARLAWYSGVDALAQDIKEKIGKEIKENA